MNTRVLAQAALILALISIALNLGSFQFNASSGIVLLIAFGLFILFVIQNLRDKDTPFQREQQDLGRIIKRMDDLITKEVGERRAKGETITTIVHNLSWFRKQLLDEHPDLVQQAFQAREQRRTNNL